MTPIEVFGIEFSRAWIVSVLVFIGTLILRWDSAQRDNLPDFW